MTSRGVVPKMTCDAQPDPKADSDCGQHCYKVAILGGGPAGVGVRTPCYDAGATNMLELGTRARRAARIAGITSGRNIC